MKRVSTAFVAGAAIIATLAAGLVDARQGTPSQSSAEARRQAEEQAEREMQAVEKAEAEWRAETEASFKATAPQRAQFDKKMEDFADAHSKDAGTRVTYVMRVGDDGLPTGGEVWFVNRGFITHRAEFDANGNTAGLFITPDGRARQNIVAHRTPGVPANSRYLFTTGPDGRTQISDVVWQADDGTRGHMKFNLGGHPYFGEFWGTDGRRSGGFYDASLEPKEEPAPALWVPPLPRVSTQPCEPCRVASDAYNEIVAKMQPIQRQMADEARAMGKTSPGLGRSAIQERYNVLKARWDAGAPELEKALAALRACTKEKCTPQTSGTPSGTVAQTTVNTPQPQIPAGLNHATAADINGDKKIDLVGIVALAAPNQHAIRIYPGNGDGTFGPPQTGTPLAGVPIDLETRDLDGDGRVDIVLAQGGTSPSIDVLSVALASTQGAPPVFTPVSRLPLERQPVDILVDRLNGDAFADIAYIATGAGFDDQVMIIPGNEPAGIGRLNFGASLRGPMIKDKTHFFLSYDQGVVDGTGQVDATPDIAVATSNGVLLFPTVPDPNQPRNVVFGTPTTVNPGTSPVGIVVSDVNEDDRIDILTVNRGSGNVSVSLGGTGGFQQPLQIPVGGNPLSISLVNFNTDAIPDIVVANSSVQAGAHRGQVNVLTGNNNGAFVFAGALTGVPAGPAGANILPADFNSDGVTDFITPATGQTFLSRPQLVLESTYGISRSGQPFGTYQFNAFVSDANGNNTIDANEVFNLNGTPCTGACLDALNISGTQGLPLVAGNLLVSNDPNFAIPSRDGFLPGPYELWHPSVNGLPNSGNFLADFQGVALERQMAVTQGTPFDATLAATWTSSNTAIATVSNASDSGVVARPSVTNTNIIATWTSSTPGRITLDVIDACIESVALAPVDPALPFDPDCVAPSGALLFDPQQLAGLPAQFQAIATLTDGSIVDLTGDFAYAFEPGVTLTDINIDDVPGIGDTVPLGIPVSLRAMGLFSDGTVDDITSQVLWSSSAPTFVAVSNQEPGVMRTASPGNATITATLGAVSDDAVVTVTDATLNSVTIEPASSTLPVGIRQQFTALGHFSDGTSHDVTQMVDWSTNRLDLVDFADEGKFEFQAAGSATITASLGALSDSADVSSVDAKLTSITIVPGVLTTPAGFHLPYTALGRFDSGQILDITTLATWTTSNGAIASVTNGLAKGMTSIPANAPEGTAIITATLGNIADTGTVTVDPKASAAALSGDQSPLDGVTVRASSLNSTVDSTAGSTGTGNYVFNNAPAGARIEILVSKSGYTTRRRVEVLKSNKSGDPNANRYDFGAEPEPDPALNLIAGKQPGYGALDKAAAALLNPDAAAPATAGQPQSGPNTNTAANTPANSIVIAPSTQLNLQQLASSTDQYDRTFFNTSARQMGMLVTGDQVNRTVNSDGSVSYSIVRLGTTRSNPYRVYADGTVVDEFPSRQTGQATTVAGAGKASLSGIDLVLYTPDWANGAYARAMGTNIGQSDQITRVTNPDASVTFTNHAKTTTHTVLRDGTVREGPWSAANASNPCVGSACTQTAVPEVCTGGGCSSTRSALDCDLPGCLPQTCTVGETCTDLASYSNCQGCTQIGSGDRDESVQYMIIDIVIVRAAEYFRGLPSIAQSARSLWETLRGFMGATSFNAARRMGIDHRQPTFSQSTRPGGASQSGATTLLTSLGTSMGEALQIQVANDGRAPINLSGNGVIVEPLRQAAGQQARRAMSQLASRNPITQKLDAYCVEMLKQPPSLGTIFRVASPEIQKRFAPMRRVLQASYRLQQAGLLKPDSDPKAYFTSIKQWALWSRERNFDEKSYGNAFVEHTKKGATESGVKWTDQIEAGVRALVPNRWADITRILQASQ